MTVISPGQRIAAIMRGLRIGAGDPTVKAAVLQMQDLARK
jgi:hypothetical protein